MYPCRVCQQWKMRIYGGDTKKGIAIHVDEEDNPWSGYVCYPCSLERARKRYRPAPSPDKTCCPNCKQDYYPTHQGMKYCSPQCGQAYRWKYNPALKLQWKRNQKQKLRQRQKKKHQLICSYCKQDYSTQDLRRKYCSPACYKSFLREKRKPYFQSYYLLKKIPSKKPLI